MYGDSTISIYWDIRILELEQRQRDLTEWCLFIAASPLPHDFNISYECWLEYREGGALPFSGGLLEQPQWLLDDFHYYDVIKEHRSLPAQIAEAQRKRKQAST